MFRFDVFLEYVAVQKCFATSFACVRWRYGRMLFDVRGQMIFIDEQLIANRAQIRFCVAMQLNMLSHMQLQLFLVRTALTAVRANGRFVGVCVGG